MDEFTYENFLQGKIKNEHAYTHSLEEQVTSLKEKIAKLLKDISVVRKSQNDLKLRNKQMQQRMIQLNLQLKKAKEIRNTRTKQANQKRLKQQKQAQIDPKNIFKTYLQNTFPKYKGIIKKLMKIFLIMEDHQNKQPLAKINFYQSIFEGIVKRILNWIFPKKTEGQKSQSIAQNLLKEWKEKQKIDKKQLDKGNVILLKEAQYINKMQKLQSEILLLKSSKNMIESRLKTFQRGLQIKGGEFIGHLKKMLNDSKQMEPQSYQRVEEILTLFRNISHLNESKKNETQVQNVSILNQVPLILTDKIQAGSKKKAAPVLKKNIYGYYQEPQFSGNYTMATLTKHANNNKHTQTLSEDLCILTLHPVIMVTLIDGNIKPQRTRQSLQFFVKIRINEDGNVDSTVKESLEPQWNEPFLLKDYDFPFIHVLLMHKSKGLRDYSIGGGKFSASTEQQKIVNIRKDKQFQGRVRFSLTYPKGNIYEFKITSVRLQLPDEKIILKEQAIIKFPYNQCLSIDFILPEKINYLQRSVIILENSEESMIASLTKVDRRGEVPLKEIIGKEGNKEVIVDLENDWKVIIQGEVYLLICQDEQPEKISQEVLQGGKGKYFSVRAPPPIVTVAYGDVLLHANIKFPLVYHLEDHINKLSIVKQQSNREILQVIVEPIVNKDGFLKLSQFIKAPSKIYKFFIETIEGEQVKLKHESHLFERLLKQIHLQISYKEDQVQQINYARKGRVNKEKLFKDFTIQSKQLMLNHYKIFSKHFKKIGFVKFKLGYTIYDNQLLNQNQSSSLVQSRKIQAIKEGVYFIELQLSQAHLLTKSSGSSYRCMINGDSSKLKKGNHVQWCQSFIISFEFKQKFQTEIAYEIWEEGTFGKDKIYDGKLIINEQIMRIGAIIINLDGNMQDCLHFSKICIPSQMIRLNIDEISAQIQEDADWIGKIDPYIKLESKNRELLKTNYLDNIGSHPVWANINKQIIIGRTQTASQGDLDQEESFLTCRLYDYDIIGKDDYLGEVQLNTKLNSQLISNGKSDILFGNLVKEKFICGSLRLKGQFQIIKQQKIKFSDSKRQKLNKMDIVYRVSIYKFSINNCNEYKGDKGTLIFRSDDKIIAEKSFQFDENQFLHFNFSFWLINGQKITAELKRQYKRFFKSFTDNLGTFTLIIEGRQVLINKTAIVNEKKFQIGNCSWFCQAQDKINYVIVSNSTFCKKPILIQSDLNDSSNLCDSSNASKGFKFIFYSKEIFYTLKDDKKDVQLKCKQLRKNVNGLYLQNDSHANMICYFQADKNISVPMKWEQRAQRVKNQQNKQYKQLAMIHWQPFEYEKSTSFQFNLRFRESDETTTLKQELSQLYNDYLIIKPYEIPIIFDAKNIPNVVEVVNPKTRRIQAVINVEESTKIFIPNKGALYYKLEDYNLKTIMQLHFKYFFIRIKEISKFKGYKNVRMTIGTTLSLKIFTCDLLGQTNTFIIENIRLLIANPPHSNTIFFEGQILGLKDGEEQATSLMKCKLGFRLQANKQQYRIADNQEYIAHAFFTCDLVQRNYEPRPPIDNTIYGMSFINITEIEFEVNQDPSNRHIFLEINISNQYQKLYLERIQNTNLCKIELDSIFYIQRTSIADFLIIQQGILSNSHLGNATLNFSETYITKQMVSIHCEVIKNKQIVGRLKVQYANVKEINFIDVNMFNYITKESNMEMVAQLQEFGPNKQKYQKLSLTSRGDVARLESEDSFIITKDPREYQITVNYKSSNQLLGQFKLCHQLSSIGEKTVVLQPLRTNMNSLNGVLIIEYENKRSNLLTFGQSKYSKLKETQNLLLLNLELSKITFKKHYIRLKDDFSVRLRSSLRQNITKPLPIQKPTTDASLSFTVYNHQACELAILDKSDVIGISKINPPYLQNEQRIIILQKDSNLVGIFVIKIHYLSKPEQYTKMREITSIEANNLIDTQYFVKMTPFIQIQQLNHLKKAYITDLGLGKQKIFWRVNIISPNQIRFTVKDKDMFFDDLIGSATAYALESQQKQDQTLQLQLISEEKDKQKVGGNGLLKICTSPVAYHFGQSIQTHKIKQVKCFLLQLGGLVNNEQLLKSVDCIQLFLVLSEDSKISLMKQYYKKDIYFYLSNKDIQIQFDTYFRKTNQQNLEIIINLYNNNMSVYEQRISNSNAKNKNELFTIYNFMPLQREFYFFQRICFWMFEKIPRNMQIFLSTSNIYEKLNIVSYEKYLITLQPYQFYTNIDTNTPLTILLKENNSVLYRLSFTLKNKNVLQNQFVVNGSIFNANDKEVGHFYTNIMKFKSDGQKYERKINIGKSQRMWLNVCICQANLTKDLEIFSKMDPYCKFGLSDNKENWNSTGVQDNIGMHPIWNQSFLIQVSPENKNQVLNFVVMDEEVSIDRMIGQGKISVTQLIQRKDDIKTVKLFFNSSQPSGELQIRANTTNAYVIFRDKVTLQLDQSDFYLFHEDNKISEKGIKIELGIAYPIVSTKKIKIKHKKSEKMETILSLKQQKITGIYFTEECAQLHYDIYE